MFLTVVVKSTNVFSSKSEHSLVSDSFPSNSTRPLSSFQFLKFQPRSFESCRRSTNIVDASTLRHNDGGDFSQWPWLSKMEGELIGQSMRRMSQSERVFGEGKQT